jgi:ParB family transcriptional regulator, chromosome partitioning protein
MPLTVSNPATPSAIPSLAVDRIRPNPFSLAIYGDPNTEIDDLVESIRKHGVLVPLVVVAEADSEVYELVSGHRRLACARALGLTEVPCDVRALGSRTARRRAVLEYNRQRRKTFSQMMREADALEALLLGEARRSRLGNLRQFRAPTTGEADVTECRNSDGRKKGTGRTDTAVANAIGLGGKDLYRQARAVWRVARTGDPRARSSLPALDAGTKTIHAAYKDLRRRDRFTTGFRPTPYDVWPFRHDRAFGIPHPGAIPPAIIAHLLHYYTTPGALVVDPMAGGGTTLDVCESMGRRCVAYDLHPVRPEIGESDVRDGFPQEASECDLIFCDPPYHTMRARRYGDGGVDSIPLGSWISFLERLACASFATLRPGGFVALLLANQTEKDLPAGWGYIDHAYLGYQALLSAGFAPERRVSCPMDGAYLPQHVQRARAEGRMLGQVRDLIIMRKPLVSGNL